MKNYYITESISYFNTAFSVVISIIVMLALPLFALDDWNLRIRNRRVKGFIFPSVIRTRLQIRYPHLKEHQIDKILAGLRIYFSMCVRYRRNNLYLPSRAVNVAWKEFQTLDEDYREFSKLIFGEYFQYIPLCPVELEEYQVTAWRYYCHDEKIAPVNPEYLPFLYAIDEELDISDGNIYSIKLGIYPKEAKLDLISPSELVNIITKKLPLNLNTLELEPIERETAIVGLAIELKRHIYDDAFISRYDMYSFSVLFDEILLRKDLMHAVFGNINQAKKRQEQIRIFIEKTLTF